LIAVGKLVANAVNVLNEVLKGASIAEIGNVSSVGNDVPINQERARPSGVPLTVADDRDENEKTILDFIVKNLDPATGGKLIAALGVSKSVNKHRRGTPGYVRANLLI